MTFQELFGTELPIIQAPMAGVQDHRLAAAVSAAGGLGSLPCGLLEPTEVAAELRALTAATDGPYNLNFFCHVVPAPDPDGEARWRELLAPYYAELGLDLGAEAVGRFRAPFGDATAAVVEELRPPVVSFHYGLPAAPLLARVKATGAKVIATATTVLEATWLEARGVDAVIAQGAEAGGHRGMFLGDVTTQVGTFALVPQVVAAVDVPVIAAGGVASAAGVRAALALGASGVQVGTAYLLCPEATTRPVHREALKSPGAAHTAITNVFTGRPARGIVNRLIRELGPLNDAVPPFPHAAKALAALRVAAEARGSTDFTHLWAGQNAAGCAEVPAGELTRRLAEPLHVAPRFP